MAWVAERKGKLGTPKGKLSGASSITFGFSIEILIYGEPHKICLMRVLMDTDDVNKAQTCINYNITTWSTALEVAIMMETDKSFQIPYMPGTYSFPIFHGPGDETTPTMVMTFSVAPHPTIDYNKILLSFASWNQETKHHLFYFRRFIDKNFPLDVRWLNGYRLLEWHFVESGANLQKSARWRDFISRFDVELTPLLRKGQNPVGLMEQVRALAAHAGIDDRPDIERQKDRANLLEKTFGILEKMISALLNEHPGRQAIPIKLKPKR